MKFPSIRLSARSQLRPLLLQLLLLLIPHHTPQNLSGRTLRHNINELDTASQPLVVALGLFHVLGNLPLDQRVTLFDRARRSHDEGLGHFAFAVRGHADDHAVADGRVGEDVGFELGGGDLHSLDFDESVWMLVG